MQSEPQAPNPKPQTNFDDAVDTLKYIVSPNPSEAVEWFKKAAAQGESMAMQNLGLCYENGDGVAKSKTEAIKWYEMAAKKGNTFAEQKLKTLKNAIFSSADNSGN